MKYKIHRFDINLKKDQEKLEKFLNDLEGEVVAIIPNVAFRAFWVHRINFLLVVEKVV
jgi:hypothetical protein